jgi:histone H2A|tara:strand:+ start:246 stop:452 length:207 start_codon:yes stop_codon:yes gene_type:complete
MSGKGAKGLSGKGLSGKGGKVSSKGDKKKPTSRSVKAGLQFPVGRIHRFLKVRPPVAHVRRDGARVTS